MKILLVSVNASYMHTNVAIRSLKYFAEKNPPADMEILFQEYTINQPAGEVLRGIGFSCADMVLFSTYIWNSEYVCKILPDVKKVLPGCITGAGGPEFGYGAKKYLSMLPSLDFVMFGEGELSFVELLKEVKDCPDAPDFSKIKGLYYRKNNSVEFTGEHALLEDLDLLPFAYPEIPEGNFDPDHKIYYYESTRGCPFSCAYCLSSVDKRVRFKSLEKVKQELKIFLDANIKLVKFIDRTYNLNPDRYIPIWEFILDNHNGKTMFHFEIEAEYLSDQALAFLKKVPAGVMQFEMGVQSANRMTLKAVNRSDNTDLLAQKIRQIPRTIHQHLDLIAGLPHEDLESFGKSFDYVMDLRPDALQLGFLKVLQGTEMADYAQKNGWKWMESPVYETFSTPHLTFSDMAFLKEIEVVTDAYWNRENFVHTMNYVFRKTGAWKFLCQIVEYGRKKDAFLQARKDSYWFELLNDFIEENEFQEIERSIVRDLLRYDFVSSGKKGNFPGWYEHRYDKEKHRSLLDSKGILLNNRIAFATSEYEVFDCDVTHPFPEKHKGNFELLIQYD